MNGIVFKTKYVFLNFILLKGLGNENGNLGNQK
jgi:hypothetical protein